MKIAGEKRGRKFSVRVEEDEETKGTCGCCGAPTRRSKYGILHDDCFGCRYLKMIFGDSITVRRIEK